MSAGRILLVEANQESVQKLQQAFKPEGYEVLIASDGEQAWDICRRLLPQAVLININLPELDDYKLLRRIRSALRTRHIHVTFLTEGRERRDKIAGLEMGADDYIFKPYDVEEVRLRTRNVLRRASSGNLVDPTTGLPSNRLIQEQLRELLRRQDDWALLRVSIKYLDEFADAHGFLAGEEVLRTIARALSEAVDNLGETSDFIGHSGGDEFIVITSTELAEKLAGSLAQDLETASQAHYSWREREQGHVIISHADGSEHQAPLLSVDIKMVSVADGPFHDIMQLTRAFH